MPATIYIMMTYWLSLIFAVLLSYGIGSISSAIVVCRLMQLPDPRAEGSKNPGATNVLRLGGKKAAIITLLGDFLKGVIPVIAAKWYGLDALGIGLVTLAVFLGHLYPVFFGFQGGKGVATAGGALLALAWPVGLSLIGIWLLIVIISRYSSLAALVATIIAPLSAGYFTNRTYTIIVIIMSALLLYRHRKNIVNLWQGKETKIGKKPKDLPSSI